MSPGLSAVVTVAGTVYRQHELEGIRKLDKVELIREPDNKYDPNAIKVLVLKRHVGYIPAVISAVMAPLIDETGQTPTATVEEVSNYRDVKNPRIVRWGLDIRIYTPGE